MKLIFSLEVRLSFVFHVHPGFCMKINWKRNFYANCRGFSQNNSTNGMWWHCENVQLKCHNKCFRKLKISHKISSHNSMNDVMNYLRFYFSSLSFITFSSSPAFFPSVSHHFHWNLIFIFLKRGINHEDLII